MTRQVTPTLTARQKRLIRESFEPVKQYSTALTKLFYGRLFELKPEVRTLFKTNIEDQSRKLLDMIVIIVEALDDFDALRPRLVELGRKHVTYGALPEHYEFIKKSLLWALGRALEMEFDAETKAAWNEMLDAVATTMLEGTRDGN
jgi:hemoglobin-like flavoprotein